MDVCSQEETQLSRVTLSVGRHPRNLSALPFLLFALHCTRPRLLKGRWPSNACQCTMHVCKNIFGIKQRKQSCSIINNNLDGKPADFGKRFRAPKWGVVAWRRWEEKLEVWRMWNPGFGPLTNWLFCCSEETATFHCSATTRQKIKDKITRQRRM